ncbi:MAG: hypothetical protein ABSA49_06210 [Rhizomicrobium sp.]|jgi:hypothetical protein
MRTILLILGVLLLIAGVVWAGQGMGYITWTPHGMHPSFMIGDKHWEYYGAATALLGLILIFVSRRR